jgi:hypothetical protein
MAIKVIKKLSGGLDKNSNLTSVAPQNYLDALDITDKSPRGQSDNLKQLNNNNDYAFINSSYSGRNKTYRVEITNIPNTSGEAERRLFFGFGIGNLSYGQGIDSGIDVLFYDYSNTYEVYLAITDKFDTYTNLGAIFTNYQEDGNTMTFDLTITYDQFYNPSQLNMMDFNMSIADDGVISNGGSYNYVVLQDAISLDKAGAMQTIKYSNLGNDLFVYSTTNIGEPQQATVEIVFNTPLLIFQIIPPIDFSLTDGMELFLSGSGLSGSNISAYFIIRRLVTGEYYIQNPRNPISNFYLFNLTSTSFLAKKNSRSLSEIGRAIKNDVKKEWTYTPLITSINLNFRVYKQIRDAIITPTDLGVNFDWTDKLNPLRRMLYMGEWMENGFLTVYNPKGLFDLDTIAVESRLQLRQNTSKVTLTPLKTGGSKPEATYVAFARYGRKSDGVLTTWSHISNTTWVRSTNLDRHVAGDTTLMALQIFVEQIPLNEFDTLQVGIVEFSSNSFKGYILPDVDINGVTETTVIDTGEDVLAYSTFPTADIEQVLQCFENAGNLLDFDNYVIASDVELSLPYDLSDFATSIELGVGVRNIVAENDIAIYANGTYIQNTYNNVEYMSTYWTSFMPTEWVRVALVIDWENGAPTSYFWIGDIKIEKYPNGLNPTEYSPTASSSINIYQYYVTATNIDTDYLLPDGKYLKDVIRDIRFAIAPIKIEVLATGIAISTIGSSPPFVVNTEYVSTNVPSAPNYNPKNWAFYSPDLINTQRNLEHQSGDIVNGYTLAYQSTQYTLTGTPNSSARDLQSFLDDVFASSSIESFQRLSSGQVGTFVSLDIPNSGYNNVSGLGCIAFSTPDFFIVDSNVIGLYYTRPINGGNSPYSTDLKNQRYFIVPQDQWYNKDTHDKDTTYSIYGGDCFPQKQYYRTVNDTTNSVGDKLAILIGFYSYNRINAGLRSGAFPKPDIYDFLTNYENYSDDYTYDPVFTPRNIFQIGRNYNSDALFIDKTIATIYYSGRRLNNALFGNNRIWKFSDNGVLENKYGKITDMSILLGTSGNNAILVKQERAVTLQYFNNTGRLVSTTIEVLLGTGDVLGTKGTFLSVGGTANKFSRAVCLSPQSGKEFDIWFDAFNQTINRFGADGSRVISDSISSFLIQNTTLFKPSEYNNEDTPAKDWGVLGTWDNQKKEYVITFRGVAKYTDFVLADSYVKGDVVFDNESFGYDGLPVLYKAKQATTNNPVSNTTYWERYDSYLDELHQCFTLVWNELDNAWKGYYTFLPKIYGNISNNYVSSLGGSTYEHNGDNNARYYCRLKTLGGTGGFSITNQTDYILISSNNNTDDMGAWFSIPSYPYITSNELANHTGYFLYVPSQDKYVMITEFIDEYNVKVSMDEPLAFEDETELYYTICNIGQPYIECVVNEGYPRYFNWSAISLNIDKPPYRLELEAGVDSLGQEKTQSYNNRDEFDYFKGVAHVQIKNDTTNGNANTQGNYGVEGYWCKEKIIFTPNIKNKLISHNTIIVEQNKKQK